jgi:hypothetical protein
MLKRISLLLLIPAILALACSFPVGIGVPAEDDPAPADSSDQITDLDSLLAALEAEGLEPEVIDTLSQPFFEVDATIVTLTTGEMQVYEFADEQAAQDAAAQVAPDGASIGTTSMMWMASPHFYRSGPLIIIYLGFDEDTASTLSTMLGEQFAGQ